MLLEILKDIYYVNLKTIKKSSKLFLDNWSIVFTGFIYTTINMVIFTVIGFLFRGVLGLVGGLLGAIVMSAMISNYLYLLQNIIKHGKITIQDFKDGFKVYLWKIYGVLFIGWISSILLNMFISPILSRAISPRLISTIISVLLLILLNPLPESIYQKFYSPWETIQYAFNFIRENWIEWFLPNILFIGILYFTTGKIINDLLAIQYTFNFDFSITGILFYIIGQVIFSFIMIYRGVLFEMLSTSTRRKRMYMRRLYK